MRVAYIKAQFGLVKKNRDASPAHRAIRLSLTRTSPLPLYDVYVYTMIRIPHTAQTSGRIGTNHSTTLDGTRTYARTLHRSKTRHQTVDPQSRPAHTTPSVSERVPHGGQPPSKGSLRGSKCTPLCNSQLPACKPIVCRRSQVSKSYNDAEQRK